MNINLINQMRDFTDWLRITYNKSANFEISIWAHRTSKEQSIEYKIWVDDLIHKSTTCLDELVGLIPAIKQYCELNKELSL